jgi:UDP-glucose 4-epimerase
VTVVVTGASGYIGQHLVAALHRDGLDTVAVMRPQSHHLVPRGVGVAEADVTDLDSVAGCIGPGDVVVHLACLAMHPSEVNPVRAFQVNTMGTFNVLRAATTGGASRVVVASTASVYGPPQTVPIDEDHPTRPTTAYGASKLAGDVFVGPAARGYDSGAAVLRFFNVFGASADGGPRPTFETLVVERARTSSVVELRAGGEEARDFVYVGDVVSALIAAVHSSATGIFNVGSGRAHSLKQLAVAAGIPPENLVVPEAASPSAAEGIPVHQADITRAGDELGFRPTVDVLDFVRALAGAS